MADFADDASLNEQRALDVALANHHARHTLTVRHLCEDCEEAIPPARIEALKGRGVTRCLSCQEDHDLKCRHGRRWA